MSDRQQRRISWQEAARMIYHTDEPDVVQINKVGYRVARGALEGSVKGQWVTFDSVVAYVAARAEQQRLQKQDPSSRSRKASRSQPHRSATASQHSEKKLSKIYRHGVQDYVAAVFRRRHLDNASSMMKAAVLIGQIVVILLPVIVIGYGYATATAPPPEQAAVQQWLQREVEEYRILKWFPPEPAPDQGGRTIRVQYRYSPASSSKWIRTDRLFLVQGDEVTFLTNTID